MNPFDPALRACSRYGWTFLAVFMVGGLLLEFLHGIKAPWYFENALRHELWVLAHAHGGVLAIVNLVFAAQAGAWLPDERKRRRAGAMLRYGALLVPIGFFLGGFGNTETDPSLPILLVPVGALMVIHAVSVTALGAWRATPAATPVPADPKLRRK